MFEPPKPDVASAAEKLAEPPRLGAAPPPAPVPKSIGLDTNTRLTLLFLAVVTLVTASAWSAGKLACNYHPSYSQKFEPVELEQRVLRPKNAALEFHHQLFLQDFELASSLASEGGIDIVERRRSECQAECQAERERRKAQAKTRAVLLRVSGISAWVRAETFFAGRVVSESYELERIDRRWLVVGNSEPPPL